MESGENFFDYSKIINQSQFCLGIMKSWQSKQIFSYFSNKIVFWIIFCFFQGEVRCLYRAFKQECPNGIVDEETFKEVYEKIFPLGDATHYAHLVFAAIDK